MTVYWGWVLNLRIFINFWDLGIWRGATYVERNVDDNSFTCTAEDEDDEDDEEEVEDEEDDGDDDDAEEEEEEEEE